MRAEFKHIRLLADVMIVAIVGNTAIMQQEESEAAQYRMLFREIMNKGEPEYHGRIVPYYGDGALSIYKSVFEAISSTIKIQTILRKMSVPVRIGLNLWDIVFRGDEIYGNAVNIASRIESFCHSGCILISEKIYEEIHNNRKIKTRQAGCFSYNNVNGPIKIYSIGQKSVAIQKEDMRIRWSKLHSKQVRTALVHPYLSSHNPGLLN